jgi:hypothetical protein
MCGERERITCSCKSLQQRRRCGCKDFSSAAEQAGNLGPSLLTEGPSAAAHHHRRPMPHAGLLQFSGVHPCTPSTPLPKNCANAINTTRAAAHAFAFAFAFAFALHARSIYNTCYCTYIESDGEVLELAGRRLMFPPKRA